MKFFPGQAPLAPIIFLTINKNNGYSPSAYYVPGAIVSTLHLILQQSYGIDVIVPILLTKKLRFRERVFPRQREQKVPALKQMSGLWPRRAVRLEQSEWRGQ